MVSVLDTNQTTREDVYRLQDRSDPVHGHANKVENFCRLRTLEFYYGKDMQPSRGRTLEF
jgi:hypothetical protein